MSIEGAITREEHYVIIGPFDPVSDIYLMMLAEELSIFGFLSSPTVTTAWLWPLNSTVLGRIRPQNP